MVDAKICYAFRSQHLKRVMRKIMQAATIAKEAIQEATRNGYDDVLVGTTG